MRIAALSAAAVATVLGGAVVATPAAAQPYGYDNCRSNGNQTAGAVIGGVAGALLGRSLAGDRHNRTEGAAIGAVAGALLGSQVAKGSDKCRDYNNSYYNNGYYNGGYYNAPAYSAYATPYARGYVAPTYSRYRAPTYSRYGYTSNYRYDRYGRPYYGY